MTATFTNAPGTRPIDTVRVEIDDIDCVPETDAMLSDESIQYFIDTNSHILLAAAAAAEAVAGKFADSPSRKKVGDLEVSYGDSGGKTVSYLSLAKSLRARAYRKAGANVYAGGVSKSDKDSIESDSDRVPVVFSVGMDDNPESGGSDRGIIDY